MPSKLLEPSPLSIHLPIEERMILSLSGSRGHPLRDRLVADDQPLIPYPIERISYSLLRLQDGLGRLPLHHQELRWIGSAGKHHDSLLLRDERLRGVLHQTNIVIHLHS